jgi:hypothetical protein
VKRTQSPSGDTVVHTKECPVLSVHLLVVQKGCCGFRRALTGDSEWTVAGPSLDRAEAEVTFYPSLHLKPFGLCAALKQGEILSSSDGVILSVTTPIESNTTAWVRSDVFHRREQFISGSVMRNAQSSTCSTDIAASSSCRLAASTSCRLRLCAATRALPSFLAMAAASASATAGSPGT